MDQMELASGDNNDLITVIEKNEVPSIPILDSSDADKSTNIKICDKQGKQDGFFLKQIDDNETKLKERIAQCKDMLTSLKQELNEEKKKLSIETRAEHLQNNETLTKFSYIDINNDEQTIDQLDDLLPSTNIYSSSLDNKLYCDENLLEYEKQLQKYQKTLNMAQIEKKNAIRKQMLAKAFKLKLLEVENQCNIEIIRIKQSLQSLEPLKLIAEKWKTDNNDNNYDTFELIPRYPELGTPSGSDISSVSNADDSESKLPF